MSVPEVQVLTGRVAALSRFLSQAAKKALLWYQLLKKNKDFHWDDHCERAFNELKEYLASPPVLTSPMIGETLYLYLAVGDSGISSVLIQDDSGTKSPVYYVSRALHGQELRYQKVEKFTYCLIITARRLRQ
ncbi:MAG: RNase H-like domain-containing protein, partial [Sweet potato little leaf phytoplasma]|nr:RNase H-like domain-containing protein [Sweet potato little leaf phytoplasma]